MDKIIEALQREQAARKETQLQFAQYLGITQATLSRIYSRDRGIGYDTLVKILTKHPELAPFLYSSGQ